MNDPDPFTPKGTLARLLLNPDEFFDRALQTLSHFAGATLKIILIAAGLAIALAAAYRVFVTFRDRRLAAEGRVVRIVPPPSVEAKAAQVFWMGMISLLRPWWKRVLFGQPFLVWQIEGRHEEISISVWVPKRVTPGLVEKVIEAAWPGSRAVPLKAEAGRPDPLPQCMAVCDLGLANPDHHPLGTGPDDDPLKLALSSLTSLEEDERAVIQVLARPAVSSARKRILRAATAMRLGVKPGPLFAVRARRQPPALRPQPDPWIEGDVRATIAKASSPLYYCLVRVAAFASHKEVARGRIHAVAGAFAIFEGKNGFRRRRSPFSPRRLQRRAMSRPYLLSVPELALLGTLPAAGSVQGLERAGAQPVAPSKSVPSEGKVVGVADRGPGTREVAIGIEDSRHHIHLIGETGTGKSTLIANLVLNDAAAGRAAVVIDPKGDLVEAILERLPVGAEERTCVLDPTDRRWAVGLDPLAGSDPDMVVDHIAGIFKRLHDPYWGPQTDYLLRGVCHILKRIPGATLCEVQAFLLNEAWRKEVELRLMNLPFLGTFISWYNDLQPRLRNEIIRALLNKVSAFDFRGPLRLTLGQSSPKRTVEELIDTGGLLLVRIPKGTLREETSRLLGALVIARVWQRCMRRASLREEERPDATLYVDEMHNYLALPRSFQDLLAEARGYRLSLVLAHQHLGQLPREMRESIGANARTKVAFAVSPEDAHVLERHFAPEVSSYDLSHLAAYQAACRPSLDGGHGRAFTFLTRPVPTGSRERAAQVRKRSAQLFAHPAKEVRREIKERQRDVVKLLPPVERDEDDDDDAGEEEGSESYPESYPEPYPEPYGEHSRPLGVEGKEDAGENL